MLTEHEQFVYEYFTMIEEEEKTLRLSIEDVWRANELFLQEEELIDLRYTGL